MTIDVSDAPTGYIEGEVYVVQAWTVFRNVIDRHFGHEGVTLEIPAHEITVMLQTHPCGGNCDILDPALAVCQTTFLAEPGGAYVIHYEAPGPTTDEASCEVTES